MNKKWLAGALIAAMLGAGALAAIPLVAAHSGGTDIALDDATRRQVVGALATTLAPAPAIQTLLRSRLQRGDYDRIGGGRALALALNADLAALARAQRPEVRFTARASRDGWLARFDKAGVAKVQRFVPKIGYLAVTEFAPITLAAPRYADALYTLDDTNALIVDLRANGGGDPEAMRLLASYFVDRPVRLGETRDPATGRSSASWTLRKTPRPPHLGELYILTSRATRAEAELFAHAMQAMGRARVVGERSAGAAASGASITLAPHFTAAIQAAPGGWEGSGVRPDIASSAGAALDTTLKTILADRLAHATTPMAKVELRKMIDAL